METNNKNQKGLITGLIISNVVLIILVLVLFLKNNDKTTQIETLTGVVDNKSNEIVSKTKELEDLGADLNRIRAEREKLGLQNDSLDSQIKQLNTYIAEIKKTSKFNASKRKELDAMVASLRLEITKKDEEIVALKSQNDSLVTNVTALSSEKVRLNDSLSTREKELAYASILKADNMKVSALKENDKEISAEEYKASKIDRIKVSFVLADNKAAKKTNKDFCVRLITPTGTVFSDPNNGGGNLKTADGQEIPYTLAKNVAFDNSNQKLEFTMLKGFNYVPGVYNVEAYCEGHKIGESNFKVK